MGRATGQGPSLDGAVLADRGHAQGRWHAARVAEFDSLAGAARLVFWRDVSLACPAGSLAAVRGAGCSARTMFFGVVEQDGTSFSAVVVHHTAPEEVEEVSSAASAVGLGRSQRWNGVEEIGGSSLAPLPRAAWKKELVKQKETLAQEAGGLVLWPAALVCGLGVVRVGDCITYYPRASEGTGDDEGACASLVGVVEGIFSVQREGEEDGEEGGMERRWKRGLRVDALWEGRVSRWCDAVAGGGAPSRFEESVKDFFQGEIVAVNEDGTFEVKFDDGEIGHSIPAENLRDLTHHIWLIVKRYYRPNQVKLAANNAVEGEAQLLGCKGEVLETSAFECVRCSDVDCLDASLCFISAAQVPERQTWYKKAHESWMHSVRFRQEVAGKVSGGRLEMVCACFYDVARQALAPVVVKGCAKSLWSSSAAYNVAEVERTDGMACNTETESVKTAMAKSDGIAEIGLISGKVSASSGRAGSKTKNDALVKGSVELKETQDDGLPKYAKQLWHLRRAMPDFKKWSSIQSNLLGATVKGLMHAEREKRLHILMDAYLRPYANASAREMEKARVFAISKACDREKQAYTKTANNGEGLDAYRQKMSALMVRAKAQKDRTHAVDYSDEDEEIEVEGLEDAATLARKNMMAALTRPAQREENIDWTSDWTCRKCKAHVWAKNRECYKCSTPRLPPPLRGSLTPLSPARVERLATEVDAGRDKVVDAEEKGVSCLVSARGVLAPKSSDPEAINKGQRRQPDGEEERPDGGQGDDGEGKTVRHMMMDSDEEEEAIGRWISVVQGARSEYSREMSDTGSKGCVQRSETERARDSTSQDSEDGQRGQDGNEKALTDEKIPSTMPVDAEKQPPPWPEGDLDEQEKHLIRLDEQEKEQYKKRKKRPGDLGEQEKHLIRLDEDKKEPNKNRKKQPDFQRVQAEALSKETSPCSSRKEKKDGRDGSLFKVPRLLHGRKAEASSDTLLKNIIEDAHRKEGARDELKYFEFRSGLKPDSPLLSTACYDAEGQVHDAKHGTFPSLNQWAFHVKGRAVSVKPFIFYRKKSLRMYEEDPVKVSDEWRGAEDAAGAKKWADIQIATLKERGLVTSEEEQRRIVRQQMDKLLEMYVKDHSDDKTGTLAKQYYRKVQQTMELCGLYDGPRNVMGRGGDALTMILERAGVTVASSAGTKRAASALPESESTREATMNVKRVEMAEKRSKAKKGKETVKKSTGSQYQGSIESVGAMATAEIAAASAQVLAPAETREVKYSAEGDIFGSVARLKMQARRAFSQVIAFPRH